MQDQTIPKGRCQCGCGEATTRALEEIAKVAVERMESEEDSIQRANEKAADD